MKTECDCLYLGCNDPIHRCLGKRVKLFVLSAHELRLEQVAASTVVLKLSLSREFYGKMLFFNCFCIRMMRLAFICPFIIVLSSQK
jgi:hypothetical protein